MKGMRGTSTARQLCTNFVHSLAEFVHSLAVDAPKGLGVPTESVKL